MFSAITHRVMVVFSYHYQSDSRKSEREVPDQPAKSGEVVAAMQHQESRLPADSAIWSACFKLGAVIRLKAANDPNQPILLKNSVNRTLSRF
jgi:hypothetical protein